MYFMMIFWENRLRYNGIALYQVIYKKFEGITTSHVPDFITMEN